MRHVPFLCPKCGEPLAKVVQTIPTEETIRRRRRCANGHTAETKERLRVRKTPDVVTNRAA